MTPFFQRLAFPLRVFILLLIASLLIILLLSHYFTLRFEDYLDAQVRTMAMNQAHIIAANEDVAAAVERRDTARLTQLMRPLTTGLDFDYVVIGDRQSIRLYHPNPGKIGKPMQWTRPGALERGESYFISGRGSIGPAIRAKTPIYNDAGQIVGVVSLGYLSSRVEGWRTRFLSPMIGVISLTLVMLPALSWLFAQHIRHQMMGMEPRQIARVVRQQEALFSAVFEGLIAVDDSGVIAAINHNACLMLGLSLPEKRWVGKSVAQVIKPTHFFLDAPRETCRDAICTFNGVSVIANRAAVGDAEGRGAVVSFRRQDEISALNAQLSQINQYVESLRIIRHEHRNWISTLAGLLQMKEYERALSMIGSESRSQQALVDTLRGTVADPQIAGLLFGKVQRARELGLTLELVAGSQLHDLPAGLRSSEIAAMIGNLLDNAFEASLNNPKDARTVELYLGDEGDDIIIEVADQGCGIPPALRENMYRRGVSSKDNRENAHGIGLWLVAGHVHRCGGTLIQEDNSPRGTIFTLFLPKVERTDDTDADTPHRRR